MHRLGVILVLGTSLCLGEVLTVREAIEVAEARHPDIKSLEQQVQSLEAKSWQAVAPAEPTLQVLYNDLDTPFIPHTSASTVYQLQQTIGFPGRAWLNRAAISDQAKAVNAQLQSMRLNVSTTVKTAYYNLALARKNLELNYDQKLSFEKILTVAKRRYEAGAITQVDLMIAQSALYQNQNDLIDLQATEKSNRAQLNLLLGKDGDSPLEIDPLKVTLYPSLDREASLKKMLDGRPEIRAVQHQYNASDKAYKLAWMSLLPDFQIVGGTTYYNQPTATPYNGASNITHTYMMGIQIMLPIWGFFNEREAITAASHDRANADAQVSSLYLQSKTAMESSLQTLEASRKKLENYQQHLLPLAEQTLNLALVNYSSGKIDFQAVTDAATAWRGTRKDFYALVVSYLTTYFSIGQLTGEDLL
jgi:outer membrane protein, heavy metal efflux system